jgi:hypothetical protein
VARLIFRPLWWLDNLAHGYLPRRVQRVLFGWLCAWCERELWKETEAGKPAEEN